MQYLWPMFICYLIDKAHCNTGGVCSPFQPSDAVKGRYFKGFFINSTEHIGLLHAPTVFGCHSRCERHVTCVAVSFNHSTQQTENCRLFNSSAVNLLLSNDNSSSVILLSTPTCNISAIVNGGWSSWVNSSACDVVCGGGSLLQTRSCTSSRPVCNGIPCQGQSQQRVNCTSTCGVISTLGNSCTQSSIYRNVAVCHRAIDGNLQSSSYSQGSCIHTKSGSNPWWQVDLMKPRTILNVTILERTDSCCRTHFGNFRIILGNSTDFQQTQTNSCFQSNIPSSILDRRTYFCEQPARGRFATIQLLGTGKTLQFCEVTFYGTL